MVIGGDVGYSCTRDADETLRGWWSICTGLTGVSNKYEVNGITYFMERGRQQDDDAITGQVWKMIGNTGEVSHCTRSGSFRIEPNGEVGKWPTGFRSW
jgi:hypothetical protein